MKESRGSAAYKKGLWAEEYAALYLMSKGYKIIKRRYKTAVGEVDLIARKDDVLVFVEVKARKHVDDSLFSITPQNKSRITRAAAHYLSENDLGADQNMRFDVIAIGSGQKSNNGSNRGSNWPFAVKHLDNAWLASA